MEDKIGRRGPKSWRYSLYDIATLTDRKYRTVRRDVEEKVLDPESLKSVVRYCAEHIWRIMK
jgi:hypothetical protein